MLIKSPVLWQDLYELSDRQCCKLEYWFQKPKAKLQRQVLKRNKLALLAFRKICLRPRPTPAQLLGKSLCWYNFYDTETKVVSWNQLKLDFFHLFLLSRILFFFFFKAVERVRVGMVTLVCYLDLFFIYKLEVLSNFVLLPSSKFYKAQVT